MTNGFAYAPPQPAQLGDVRFYGFRTWSENGQLYASFADVRPFSSLTLTITEVGTGNTAMFDLNTPGVVETSANGWYFASIPIHYNPTSLNPEIELTPIIRSVGTTTTKGYVRTLAW